LSHRTFIRGATTASDFCDDVCFNAHRTERAVARHTAIFRLDYVRVTACRTDFRPFIQPPRRIPFGFWHDA